MAIGRTGGAAGGGADGGHRWVDHGKRFSNSGRRGPAREAQGWVF
jgi:hypothetical protein